MEFRSHKSHKGLDKLKKCFHLLCINLFQLYLAIINMSSPNNSVPQPHVSLLLLRLNVIARLLVLELLLGCHDHSVVIQETDTCELEEHCTKWTYSKSVVALDMTWNRAFMVVLAIMVDEDDVGTFESSSSSGFVQFYFSSIQLLNFDYK